MKTIYLIDDDFEEAELFTEAIAQVDSSISIKSFNSGSAALSELKTSTETPDLIFLDLNMPMFSGKDVLKELRANPTTSLIPVVIYSTSISRRDIEETEQYHVKGYLQKPENFAALCNKLADQLNAD